MELRIRKKKETNISIIIENIQTPTIFVSNVNFFLICYRYVNAEKGFEKLTQKDYKLSYTFFPFYFFH